jgi:creatinine amidohydrolase/Fe(II)-dependent formamide hydrolase-like protein
MKHSIFWTIFISFFLLLFTVKILEAQELDQPNPIAKVNSMFIEELTWMEVRDYIQEGKTNVIVATGGIEQNGPFVVTGKHNYVLQATTEAIARKLGNTLVAPIVKYVPEGTISPPSGHMLYPGTISLSEETFKLLLIDIASSLKQHGFKNIIFICDSGGNRKGMKEVEKLLNNEWKNDISRILYIDEYYMKDAWSFNYLKEIGVKQLPDVQTYLRQDIHSDYHYEAIIATVDPKLIRTEQRIQGGNFTINDFDMNPLEKTIENGKKLIEYRAKITVDAIGKALEKD